MDQDYQQNVDFLLANGFYHDHENRRYLNEEFEIIVSEEMVRFTYPTPFASHIVNLINRKL